MRSRRGLTLLLTATALAALLAQTDPAQAGRRHRRHDDDIDRSNMKHTHRELRLSKDREASLEIEFDAGRLEVTRGTTPGVVTLDLYQTAGLDTPEVSLDQDSGHDLVRIASGDWEFEHDGENIRIRDGSSKDEDDGEDQKRIWEIRLPSDVEFDVRIASGASRSDVDFTGLRIGNLEIATGAGDMEIRFDRPNPGPGGALTIQGGACRFAAYGLGNARFRSLTFAGGVGDFLLDFSGEPRDEARAELDLGLGKLRVELPASLGVKLDASGGALAHLDVDGLDQHGDSYVSPGYGRAGQRLTLDISAALGLVEVVRD